MKSSFSNAKNPIGVCLTRVLQFYSQFQWILRFFSHQNHHLSQIHHLSWNHHLFPLQNHHISIYFRIFQYMSIHFPWKKRCDFALMALRRSSKSRQLRVPKRRLPRRAKTTREAWPGLGPWDPGTLSRDFHGSKMVPFWRILEDHQKR